MDRIREWSVRLRLVAQTLAVALVVACLVVLYGVAVHVQDAWFGITTLLRLGIGVVELLTFVRLMRLYEQGIVFRPENVRLVRRIGTLAVIAALLPQVDWDVRKVRAGVDFLELFGATFIWVVGWVMNEARRDREQLNAVA